MSRIATRFAELKSANRAAFVPFITAGDPDAETTAALLDKLPAAGADLIELGVPFSDPTADGPVIQRAGVRALARGTSLRQILELVADLRAGVDGLLVVDLPPEEADELWKPARAEQLDVIFLLAPTSDERRIKAVLRKASGFVYFVSMTGITGSKAIDTADVAGMVATLRRHCRLPVGVGFGISTPEQAAAVAEFADAVVVGSAITRLIEMETGSPSLVPSVGAFMRALKDATRRSAAA